MDKSLRIRWNWPAVFALISMTMSASGCFSGSADTETLPEQSVEEANAADTADVQNNESIEDLPDFDQGLSSETASTTETQPAVVPESVNTTEDPALTVAPATEPVSIQEGELGEYTVQNGDTLMKIAFYLYGDINRWRSLFEQNQDILKNANTLEVGKTLKYEKTSSDPAIEKNGEPYLVKEGDTLGTISYQIYATSKKWRKLYENNRTLIQDPNKIYAGFYLYYQMTEQEKQEAERLRMQQQAAEQGEKQEEPESVVQAPDEIPATEDSTETASPPEEREPSSGEVGNGLNQLKEEKQLPDAG